MGGGGVGGGGGGGGGGSGGLLLGEQFGFRSGGSLTLHVAPLVGKVNRKFNEKRPTGTVFLYACG